MKIGKYEAQDVIKVASTAFAVFSVVKTIHDARRDEDGLQFAEALVRGAALSLAIAILVRNLRGKEDELALEGMPA